MPDTAQLPRDWNAAFAALPLERPAPDTWQRLAARLDARRTPRWPIWIATAAALMLAIALPWRLAQHDVAVDERPAPAPAQPLVVTSESLEQLQAQSAQFEALLSMARDERVASAAAASVANDFDRQLASIDAALMQPGLSPGRQLQLWRDRVQTLQSVVGFEGTRRWLASQGERYDGALVRVD